MGHKIFISYKFGDNKVKHFKGDWYENNTVRTYVDELENYIKDLSDHIYKGESDDEDLSTLDEDTIWNKLKNRIYDSTLTIVMISKGMKEDTLDREQWIPWEISYSLKEMSRKDTRGNAVTSKTNAMLAIIIPDENDSYRYYTYDKKCSGCTGCRILLTNQLFYIMKKNMFNEKTPNTINCDDGSEIYRGDSSYISSVKWSDFISNVDNYIDKAYEIQENKDSYNIYKDVD